MVSESLGVNLVIIATKINPATEPTKNETMAEIAVKIIALFCLKRFFACIIKMLKTIANTGFKNTVHFLACALNSGILIFIPKACITITIVTINNIRHKNSIARADKYNKIACQAVFWVLGRIKTVFCQLNYFRKLRKKSFHHLFLFHILNNTYFFLVILHSF